MSLHVITFHYILLHGQTTWATERGEKQQRRRHDKPSTMAHSGPMFDLMHSYPLWVIFMPYMQCDSVSTTRCWETLLASYIRYFVSPRSIHLVETRDFFMSFCTYTKHVFSRWRSNLHTFITESKLMRSVTLCDSLTPEHRSAMFVRLRLGSKVLADGTFYPKMVHILLANLIGHMMISQCILGYLIFGKTPVVLDVVLIISKMPYREIIGSLSSSHAFLLAVLYRSPWN